VYSTKLKLLHRVMPIVLIFVCDKNIIEERLLYVTQ